MASTPGSTRQLKLGFELPMFVTKKNKILSGFFLGVLATVLYEASNHFQFLQPQFLPMTWLDRNAPFIPQTVWVYISEYPYFVLIYWLCKDVVNLNKYLYSFISLQTVSVLIFFLWPTTYPRAAYPLDPSHMDAWTYGMFSMLRVGDTPVNCAPSLHVSSVFLCAFLFLNEQRSKLPYFLIWATLIGLSTLTTKQHYLVDILSGLGMAILFHWIFYRWVSYRPLQANR